MNFRLLNPIYFMVFINILLLKMNSPNSYEQKFVMAKTSGVKTFDVNILSR